MCSAQRPQQVHIKKAIPLKSSIHYPNQVNFLQAWSWQQKLLSELLTQTERNSLGSVLLLQHPPVLTLGAGSTEDNLLFDPKNPPFPLFRTERGGEATYHGPGQLVMYPVLNLQKLKPDLHWYLRSLEEIVIR